MKKYNKLYQLKQVVKYNQEFTKYSRLSRKKNKPQNLKEPTELYVDFNYSRYDNRIVHIAYSLLKGKVYQQIENSVKPENQLEDWQWNQIVELMNLYKDDENIVVIPKCPFPKTIISYHKHKENV